MRSRAHQARNDSRGGSGASRCRVQPESGYGSRASEPRRRSGALPARALPRRCVDALQQHREQQDADRARAGSAWRDLGLVFTTTKGTALDAANVRRGLHRITERAGLTSCTWAPRELRHSFVSLLSDDGVKIEDIADLCGHAGTRVTEMVYRHQLRPVLLGGAVVMDRIFPTAAPDRAASHADSHAEPKKRP